MYPNKLPERDSASFLRDRVRKAFQAAGKKPLSQSIKEAVPYGDHDLQLTSVDNPATLKVDCGVRCRKCSWWFRSSTDLLIGGKQASDRAILEGAFYLLLRQFVTEVDSDCKTASLMAVVTAVHEL
jgi:hypothetical protein